MARHAARNGDDGSNDLLVCRTNEFQVCFVAEHLVDDPTSAAASAAVSVSLTKQSRPRWATIASTISTATGLEYIASADMSCLLHMKGVIDRLKLPLKVVHIAQILNGGPL